MTEQENLRLKDACFRCFVALIQRAVEDYVADVKDMQCLSRRKPKREAVEFYESARWFLFSPDGLEHLIEKYEMQYHIKIDAIRHRANQIKKCK